MIDGMTDASTSRSAPTATPAVTPAVMPAATRADIARLHTFERWPARKLWPMIAALALLSFAATSVWNTAYRPLLLLIWPALGYVLFVFVLAFHDASHGRLHPVRRLNEGIGHLIGSLSLVPLSVYRYAHARHHAYLGTERDPELWPFNTPGTPRPLRVLTAAVEILFGFVYTPLLFLRSVAVGELSRRERGEIVRGYAGCVLAWTVNLAVVHHFGLWELFLVTAGVPMAISGMLQTLNKFMQHLGLHGRTVLGLTRTVVDEHRCAEMISASMLYNDYHGTHHRYAKIPYYHLPPATPYTLAGAREACPVFPSVFSALADMLPCLADPKVGPQWTDASKQCVS